MKPEQLIYCQKNPQSRYELDPTPFTGEDYTLLAEQRIRDVERTARQLRQIFAKVGRYAAGTTAEPSTL